MQTWLQPLDEALWSTRGSSDTAADKGGPLYAHLCAASFLLAGISSGHSLLKSTVYLVQTIPSWLEPQQPFCYQSGAE